MKNKEYTIEEANTLYSTIKWMVSKEKVENPSDVNVIGLLTRQFQLQASELTNSALAWFDSLIDRGGAAFSKD